MASARELGADESGRVRQRIAELAPWFHNYEVAKGIWTNPLGDGPGVHYPALRWAAIKRWLADVDGKSVLDVGCSAGFFSLKLCELGCWPVIGVDDGEQRLAIAQATFAAETLQLSAEFRELSVYDVAALETEFDIVLFMGVFYHLRHPLLALEALRRACKGTLILQTITVPNEYDVRELLDTWKDVVLNSRAMRRRRFPELKFIEGKLGGDGTCWFVPNVEAVYAMLRASGFTPRDCVFADGQSVFVQATAD